MSAAEPIVAPSDAQLAYIAGLCREQGWTPPEAVYSKREASEIIGALKASTYRAEDYAVSGSPVPGDADYGGTHHDDYEEVPF